MSMRPACALHSQTHAEPNAQTMRTQCQPMPEIEVEEEMLNSPSTPTTSTSTREPTTVDGPNEPQPGLLYQFDTPQGPKFGWYHPFVFVEAFHAGHTWGADDVTAWRELTPVAASSGSPPVARPPGREVAAIRADLAALDEDAEVRLDVRAKQHAARRRLLADVASLLDRLEAVDALLEQAGKVSPSSAMTVYVGDVERALGRRAEAVRGVVGANQ